MTEILFASSYDEENGPEKILTGNKREFWTSTGLFPQEIFIQLDKERNVSSIYISCYGVKRISIETCDNDSAVNFTKQTEMNDLPNLGKVVDITLNFNSPGKTKLIKVTILEGYEDFCTIHSLTLK